MRLTNNGAATISIDGNTHIRFDKSLGTRYDRSSGQPVLFYVVYNQGTDTAPSLVTYGGANVISLAPGESRILYFATNLAGNDPSRKNTFSEMIDVAPYTGFLLLYDSNLQYGQTIPYIAINAV
jgi:hypothetical protein